MNQESNVPEGYAQEEWAEYQADPVSFCIKELNNSDSSVRFNAADILRGLATDAEPAIPALTKGLNDSDFQVRAQCLFALAEIGYALGELPEETISCLIKCLSDSNAEIRALAAYALPAGKILSSEVIAYLKEMACNDPDEEVRQYVTGTLKRVQPEYGET
ncbi:MAG TPA: HEAT repeat domain-containing protein [Blastocatellia bacterium]|jgi:HEAT repeat protein